MRVPKRQLNFLKKRFLGLFPDALVYLFGSRVDDTAKGGDIDILVLTPEKIDLENILTTKLEFYRRFGDQKLDIVNFRFDQNSPFKELTMKEGLLL